jgi:hypothetical protein
LSSAREGARCDGECEEYREGVRGFHKTVGEGFLRVGRRSAEAFGMRGIFPSRSWR